jgi:hypothetical protein
MGSWYWIGVLVGIGVAFGVVSVARGQHLYDMVVGVVAGVLLGVLWRSWPEGVGGGVGAVCGAFGARPIVAGALRRGGTKFGVWLIVAGAAVAFAALGFVPALGYLEAVALPALGLRVRGRMPDTHAGLRTLTKD